MAQTNVAHICIVKIGHADLAMQKGILHVSVGDVMYNRSTLLNSILIILANLTHSIHVAGLL